MRNHTNHLLRLYGAKILLVDDHVDLTQNVTEILEDEGASVLWAPTAERAETVWDDSFAVALVDIQLPDATGLQLLPKLKEKGSGLAEIMLVTGNASMDDAIEALKIGAYDYVLKPLDPEHLIASVVRAVRQVNSARETAKLNAALADREANLSALVDAVQALLLELNPQGEVLRANPAVLRCLGLQSEEVQHHDWFDYFVHTEDRQAMRELFAKVCSGHEPKAPVEFRVVPAAPEMGGPRWVSWHLSRVSLESGEIRVYASGIDVTELRELERQQRINEKLAAVGTLSAGLAHEIRNPLNAMSLQMQLLQRRVAKVSEHSDIAGPMSVLYSEIARLSNLVDDFLRYARPTKRRDRWVDLSALVKRVLQLQCLDASERGVELVLEAPEEVWIRGDDEKLRQVFVNLIANAVDAAQGRGRVCLKVERVQEVARVLVQDEGHGIPESDLARIFVPFFSTKEHGTGLGMAICHRLVSLLGGTISVQSKAGVGTDVAVEFPDAAAAGPEPSAELGDPEF